MYIGGMGGTGKTQVLKALVKFFELKNEAHRILIVAPTGTAAALLGGFTYHSAFRINDWTHVESDGSQVMSTLTGVDYIFLDEVSMLSAYDMHKISSKLCHILGIKHKPFGGLNMIFAGDFAQLPPIQGENASLYGRKIGENSSAKKSQEQAIGKSLWHQVTTVVILQENMHQRQQSADDAKL